MVLNIRRKSLAVVPNRLRKGPENPSPAVVPNRPREGLRNLNLAVVQKNKSSVLHTTQRTFLNIRRKSLAAVLNLVDIPGNIVKSKLYFLFFLINTMNIQISQNLPLDQLLNAVIQRSPLTKKEILRISESLGLDLDPELDLFTLKEELGDELVGKNKGIIESIRHRLPKVKDIEIAIILLVILGIISTTKSFYNLLQSGVSQQSALTYIFFTWKVWVVLLLSAAPFGILVRIIRENLKSKIEKKKLLKLLNMFHNASVDELETINQCSKMRFVNQIRYCSFSFWKWFKGGLRGGWELKPGITLEQIAALPGENGLREVLRQRFLKVKKEISRKKTPQKKSSQKKTSRKKTSRKKTPQKKTPQKKSSQKKSSQKKSSQKKTSQKKSSQKKTSQKKTPQKKSSQKKLS
jgi:hypothetical protein